MIRRPLGLSLAASGSIQLLVVLTGVLLARILGPEARGELAAVLLWPMVIGTAGGAGVTDAITFYSARERWPLPTIAATALVLAVVLGGVLAALSLGAVSLALAGQDADVRAAGYLFVASVPLSLVALGAMAVLHGHQRFGWFNALRVVVFAAGGLAIVALAADDALTVTSATVGYLGAALVTAGAAVYGLRRAIGPIRGLSRAVAREVLSYGAKSQLSAVSNLLNERVDQLVISVALPPAKLGLYVVALTLSAPIALIGSSLSLTALPVIAAQPQVDRLTAARRYVSLALIGSLVLALPLALLAPQLIRFFFGSSFEGSGDSARILALAAVSLGVGRTLGSALKAVQRPLDAGIAEAIGLVVTAAGLATLLPTVGILGAALTSLAAYTAAAGYALNRASRALGVGGLRLLLPPPGMIRQLLGRVPWKAKP